MTLLPARLSSVSGRMRHATVIVSEPLPQGALGVGMDGCNDRGVEEGSESVGVGVGVGATANKAVAFVGGPARCKPGARGAVVAPESCRGDNDTGAWTAGLTTGCPDGAKDDGVL